MIFGFLAGGVHCVRIASIINNCKQHGSWFTVSSGGFHKHGVESFSFGHRYLVESVVTRVIIELHSYPALPSQLPFDHIEIALQLLLGMSLLRLIQHLLDSSQRVLDLRLVRILNERRWSSAQHWRLQRIA